MKAKHLAIAAAILLLALGTVAEWRGSGPPESGPRRAAAPPPVTSDVEVGVPVLSTPPVTRAPVAGATDAEPVTQGAGPWWTVRVVGAEDAAPIPGARVFHRVVGPTNDPARKRAFATWAAGGGTSYAAFLEATCDEVTTGVDGEARIPVVDRRFSVEVVAGEGYGRFAGMSSEPVEPGATLEVTVEPWRRVEVHVVGAAGRAAAGVCVALGAREPGMRSTGAIGMARTDSRGWTSFALNPFDPLFRSPSTALVGLGVPLDPSVERVIDRRGGDRVELVLPRVASVRVRVVDDLGAPLPDGCVVTLERLAGGLPSRVATVDGTAEFRHVGVDLDLRARLFARDQDYVTPPVALRSPDEEGGVAEATLRAERRSVRLVGTIVDENGTPQAGRAIRASAGSMDEDLTTDAEGRFSFRVTERAADGGVMELRDPDDPRSSTEHRFRGHESRPQIDVGAIEMSFLDPPARGTVVDAAGGAVFGADLEYVRPGDIAAGEPDWVRLSWLHRGDRQRSPAGRSHLGGAFALRGMPAELPAWVVAEVRGVRTGAPVPFQAGAQDLRVVIPARAAPRGRVRVDSSIPARGVRVRLWDEARGDPPSDDDEGWVAWGVREDGTLVGFEVTAGRYTLVFSGTIVDADPVVVRGVVLDAEQTIDPRLDPLDLRGRFVAVELRVRDESGAVTHANGSCGTLRFDVRDRTLLLPASFEGQTVQVEREGFATTTFVVRPGRHDVTLRRGD